MYTFQQKPISHIGHLSTRLFILTFVFLFANLTLCAQTFVCTDIKSYDPNMSQSELHRLKKDGLGKEITLKFYDNAVKILFTNPDGEADAIVYDKKSSNEYEATERCRDGFYRYSFVLNKWVEYIRSVTANVYRDNKLITTMTFKRK